MFRKVAITLFIALVVTAAIFGLHQLPGYASLTGTIFHRLMDWFAAPGIVGRALVPAAAYGIVGGLAFLSGWIMLSIRQAHYRIRALGLLVLVVLGTAPTLGLYAILFQPLSAVLAIVLAIILSVFFTSSRSGQRRLAVQELIGGRVSSSLFETFCASSSAIVPDAGMREVTILTMHIFHRESPAIGEDLAISEASQEDPEEGMGKAEAESPDRASKDDESDEGATSPAISERDREGKGNPDAQSGNAEQVKGVVKSARGSRNEANEMSPKADSPGHIELASSCLQESNAVLKSAGGYLDDTGADCVRAFFGLGGEDDEHASSACRAALALRESLESKLAQRPEIDFGIAVNTGRVRVGIFDTGRSRFFSGVGGDVDFSRRLSLANLSYGTRILIGALTNQQVADSMEVRPIDMLFIPEAEVMFEVCELLAPADGLDEAALTRRDAFWKGVISYRERDHEAAAKHFASADPGDGSDLPLEFYREKVERDLHEAEAAEGDGNQKRPRRSHARLANTI